MWLAFLNLIFGIPGHVDEMKAREIRIHQCLQAKTCTSTWSPSMGAYIIKYKEPSSTEIVVKKEEVQNKKE